MGCINDTVLLATPNGDIETDICINYSKDKEDEIYINTVKINYGGKELCATANEDYLGVDTFADLQRRLPKEIKLKCCLTCKHGNMCPVGNLYNEIFAPATF